MKNNPWNQVLQVPAEDAEARGKSKGEFKKYGELLNPIDLFKGQFQKVGKSKGQSNEPPNCVTQRWDQVLQVPVEDVEAKEFHRNLTRISPEHHQNSPNIRHSFIISLQVYRIGAP